MNGEDSSNNIETRVNQSPAINTVEDALKSSRIQIESPKFSFDGLMEEHEVVDTKYGTDPEYVDLREKLYDTFLSLINEVKQGSRSPDEVAYALAMMEAQRVYEAELDPLLGKEGILNRSKTEDRLMAMLEIAKRLNLPLSVAMVDLDYFKAINDTFGHSTGDEVLKTMAGELKAHLRVTDQIFRHGGEEFVIAFMNANSEQVHKRLQEILEKVPQAIRSISNFQGKDPDPERFPFTFSAGVYQYDREKVNNSSDSELSKPNGVIKHLLRIADERAYGAKQHGRGTIVSTDIGPQLEEIKT